MKSLETMDFDVLLLHAQLRDHELTHLSSLVTLHLDNLTHFLVLDNVSIASKVLLKDLQNSLQIIFCWNSLHRGQSLSTVSLLDTDVNVVGGSCFVITSVCERIERLEVFNRHI